MFIQFPVLRGQSLSHLLGNASDSNIPHHDVHLNRVISCYLYKLVPHVPTSEMRPFVINLKKYICQSLSLACATPSP